MAFLSGSGAAGRPLPGPGDAIDAASIKRSCIRGRASGRPITGLMSANRHSALDQINTRNVSKLALQWIYSIPYFGLESTPLVSDGVMYVSGQPGLRARSRGRGEESGATHGHAPRA